MRARETRVARFVRGGRKIDRARRNGWDGSLELMVDWDGWVPIWIHGWDGMGRKKKWKSRQGKARQARGEKRLVIVVVGKQASN